MTAAAREFFHKAREKGLPVYRKGLLQRLYRFSSGDTLGYVDVRGSVYSKEERGFVLLRPAQALQRFNGLSGLLVAMQSTLFEGSQPDLESGEGFLRDAGALIRWFYERAEKMGKQSASLRHIGEAFLLMGDPFSDEPAYYVNDTGELLTLTQARPGESGSTLKSVSMEELLKVLGDENLLSLQEHLFALLEEDKKTR